MHEREQNTLLALAREAIASSLGLESSDVYEKTVRDNLPVFRQKRGLFVTLRTREESGELSLRGCIGNLSGYATLLESVIHLARQAAFSDMRFPAVRLDELHNLNIEISVLSPSQRVSSYQDIRLGIDGVILTQGAFRSVFLPQVALEQGWDLEQMLEQLCLKAGIAPTAWSSGNCNFEVFQADIFSEKHP